MYHLLEILNSTWEIVFSYLSFCDIEQLGRCTTQWKKFVLHYSFIYKTRRLKIYLAAIYASSKWILIDNKWPDKSLQKVFHFPNSDTFLFQVRKRSLLKKKEKMTNLLVS